MSWLDDLFKVVTKVAGAVIALIPGRSTDAPKLVPLIPEPPPRPRPTEDEEPTSPG